MKSKPLFPGQKVTSAGQTPSQELVEIVQRIVSDILDNESATATVASDLATVTSDLAALRSEFGGMTAISSDVTNSTTSIADITGLSFPVVAGNRYYFRFSIDFTSAATTTGARFSINGPSASRLSFRVLVDSGTFALSGLMSLTAYDTPATAVGTSAGTAANFGLIEGFVTASANGTVIGRFASEVGASAITVKAGSMVRWVQV